MKKPEWRSMLAGAGYFIVILVILVGLGALVVGVPKYFGAVPPGEIQMGLVVALAIGSLLGLLTVMAAVFSNLRLANPHHALGLPEGSIRALIALFLIMMFIIMSVYLFRTIAGGVTPAAEQLALQMVTILGTLVTAVSAFYFGSQTAKSSADTDESAPQMVALSVDSIAPPSAPATTVALMTEISGTGFAAGAQVKLRRTGSADIDGTNVTVVGASKITCSFDVSGSQTGKWDVVVINPDGRQAGKSGLFQIV